MKRQNILRRFFICCFLGLLTGLFLFEASAKEDLSGEWREDARSISRDIPITVNIDADLLTIESTTCRSNIMITISNGMGSYYEETVPSENTRLITIDLSDAPKGTYRLDMKNQWGDHLTCDFEIE